MKVSLHCKDYCIQLKEKSLKLNLNLILDWLSTCPLKPIEPIQYRLPNNLVPNLYELEIRPYIGTYETYKEKSFTFSGTVSIHFTCFEETDRIILHSKDLNITSKILTSNKKDVGVKDKFDINIENDFLTIYPNSRLQKNTDYIIEIAFNGTILDKLYGFYRSSYNSSDNQTY